MKKILIFSHALEIGGAERALIGLLESIDTSVYSVDLFLMRHEGELMSYIPQKVNLLPEVPEYACLAVPFSDVVKKKQIKMAIGRFVGKRKAQKRVKLLELPADNDVALQYSHKYTLPYVPAIMGTKYDLAISFLTPHYFVAEKVVSSKKIAWIHTDYSMVSIDADEQYKMWNKYDHIVSISEDVTNAFLKVFPRLRNKLVLIPNIMPIDFIREQALKADVTQEMPKDGSIRLLSIGRFCVAKNFDNVPLICRLIRENGMNVKWYLIGFGSDEALIKEKIVEAGMQDYVVILGKKTNPYPYLTACDLYVQPSRYEGKCVSVVEAQILHKPVVITEYATSMSQLENGIDGAIVPMKNEQCAQGIIDLLRDSEKINQIAENLKKRDYSNREKVKHIYDLF